MLNMHYKVLFVDVNRRTFASKLSSSTCVYCLFYRRFIQQSHQMDVNTSNRSVSRKFRESETTNRKSLRINQAINEQRVGTQILLESSGRLYYF